MAHASILVLIILLQTAMQSLCYDVFEGDPSLGTQEVLKVIHDEPHYLLAGGRNWLYNLSKPDIGLNSRHKWPEIEDEGKTCTQAHYAAYKGNCFTYVLSATKLSEAEFVVCAAVGLEPICRDLVFVKDWSLSAPSTFRPTFNKDHAHVFAPPWQWIRHILMTTAEGVYYCMTMSLREYVEPIYGLFRSFDPKTEAKALRSNTDQLRPDLSNYNLLDQDHQPVYAGMFETEHHVYFIYNEIADEASAIATENVVYSRVARVCKNDKGITDTFFFKSFVRKRIICRPIGSSGPVGLFDTVEDIATFKQRNHSNLFVGSFGLPKGFPSATALCIYNISDVENAFPPPKGANGSIKCPEDSYKTLSKNYTDRLLLKPLNSITDRAIFYNDRYRVTRIVADWGFESRSGKVYDTFFAGTDDGYLLKIVKFSHEDYSQFKLIEERRVPSKERVEQMKLIVDDLGQRYIIVSTYGDIYSLPSPTPYCWLGSDRDPYCTYSWSANRALNISVSVLVPLIILVTWALLYLSNNKKLMSRLLAKKVAPFGEEGKKNKKDRRKKTDPKDKKNLHNTASKAGPAKNVSYAVGNGGIKPYEAADIDQESPAAIVEDEKKASNKHRKK